MNWIQRLWHRWFGAEYIMEFDGEYSFSHSITRVYLIEGWYFKKGMLGKIIPLRRSMMADSVFTLIEANSKLVPGSMMPCQWAPITRSLHSWFLMLPDDPLFQKSDVTGVRYTSFAPGDGIVD